VLDATDEALNYVPKLVSLPVESLFGAVGASRDDGLGTCGADSVTHSVAVIRLVCDDVLGFGFAQKNLGAGYVMPFSFRQMQLGRLTIVIHGNMDLGAETAAGPS
jgi:hypothetical protein